LREKTKFDDVKPALQAAEGLMGEVAGNLREPKTDAEVVSAQGTISRFSFRLTRRAANPVRSCSK
jgi:hypothetical protein